MCASAHVRFASPISSSLDGIVEVDVTSSSPSDAAADSASEAEPLDCVVSMCDEHGLLGGLAGGAAGEEEDVLGMAADADFFAASAGGNPTWASAADAKDDGSAAAAASASDCAVRPRSP